MSKYAILQEFVERLREDAITDEDRAFASHVSEAVARFVLPKLKQEIRELERQVQMMDVLDSVVRVHKISGFHPQNWRDIL